MYEIQWLGKFWTSSSVNCTTGSFSVSEFCFMWSNFSGNVKCLYESANILDLCFSFMQTMSNGCHASLSQSASTSPRHTFISLYNDPTLKETSSPRCLEGIPLCIFPPCSFSFSSRPLCEGGSVYYIPKVVFLLTRSEQV